MADGGSIKPMDTIHEAMIPQIVSGARTSSNAQGFDDDPS
jgi:hypothetical protein